MVYRMAGLRDSTGLPPLKLAEPPQKFKLNLGYVRQKSHPAGGFNSILMRFDNPRQPSCLSSSCHFLTMLPAKRASLHICLS